MRLVLGAAALSICLVGASACESTQSASTFTSQEAMRAQPVAFGELISIRAVEIATLPAVSLARSPAERSATRSKARASRRESS